MRNRCDHRVERVPFYRRRVFRTSRAASTLFEEIPPPPGPTAVLDSRQRAALDAA